MAESFKPLTKKLEDVDKSTEKLEEIFKKVSQLDIENTQPAVENTQPAIENTQNQAGVVYDTSLQNTLKNMEKSSDFFKTHEDQERGWLWNGKTIKMLGGTRVEFEDKEFDLTMISRKSFLIQQRVLKRNLRMKIR